MRGRLIGAKGGGDSFKVRPDNLRSIDSFEAVLGLCSGRIKGLTKGFKSLYLNDVPLEDGSGNSNFQNFVATLWDGDPAFIPVLKLNLGGSAGAVAVGNKLTNPTGSNPDWRVAAVSTPGVDFIDLRFLVNQLFIQDKKGVRDTQATIEIELQPSGSSTWINPLLGTTAPNRNNPYIGVQSDFGGIYQTYVPRDFWLTDTTWKDPHPGSLRISGKTTSTYVKEVRIAVPNTGAYTNKTWTVRCRLIERDHFQQEDPQIEEQRDIVFESIAGVSTKAFGGNEAWRGLAYLQLNGRASDQLQGIPSVWGEYDLKMVKCPSNTVWNPETRVYTGALWDGTDQIAFTRDPAWVLRDFIEDPISGIAALVPGARLNKWDALEASRYYSELVPDGHGGQRPRFNLDLVIDQPKSAEEMANFLAGAVNSFTWDQGDGEYRLRVDKPGVPVAIYTQHNIVGEFVYSHTDADQRFNQVIGVFNDPTDNYRESRVRVWDQADIDLRGLKSTEIALVGCTNRQEALARVMYRLRVALNEHTQVSFATNRQGIIHQAFDEILIADDDLGYALPAPLTAPNPADSDPSNNRITGRIQSLNGARTQITLRDTVRLEIGVTYTVHFTRPNPAYNPTPATEPSANWEKPTITWSTNITAGSPKGDVNTLILSSSLPSDIDANAPFSLSAAGLPAIPRLYRILDIEPIDEEQVRITANVIDTGKWSAMDNVSEDDLNNQGNNAPNIVPPPLEAADVFELLSYVSDFAEHQILQISWLRPSTVILKGFRVEYEFNGGERKLLTELTNGTSVELPDPMHGDYKFFIYSVDHRNIRSLPLVAEFEVTEIGSSAAIGGITAFLTRPAVVIATNPDGTGGDYSFATGRIQVIDNGFDVSADVNTGYEIIEFTGGLGDTNTTLDVTHGSPTFGQYTITNCTADQGSVRMRVTRTTQFGSVELDLDFTIAKAKEGSAGQSVVVQGSTSSSGPWHTGLLTGDLFMRVSNDGGGTFGPAVLIKGENGSPGADGSLYQYVFRRSAAQPATPTGNNIPIGWFDTPPADDGNPLWFSVSKQNSSGVLIGSWSVPVRSEGTAGLSIAELTIFRRSSTTPTTPSGGSYNFTTKVLTPPSDWSTSVPTGTSPVYSCRATAAISGSVGTAAPGPWSAPVKSMENGVDGKAVDIIFIRANSQPSTPAASSGTPAGWSSDVNSLPAGTAPIWSSVGTRPDTSSNFTWQTPVRIEGKDGNDTYSLITQGSNTSTGPGSVLTTSSAGWGNEGAYSPQQFTNGVYIAFNTPNLFGTNEQFMVALNGDNAGSSNFTDLDHAFHFVFNGTSFIVEVYESGTRQQMSEQGGAVTRPWSAIFRYSIVYDGRFVNYFEDNTLLHRSDVGPGRSFGIDYAANKSASVNNLVFGPVASTAKPSFTLVANGTAPSGVFISGNNIRTTIAGSFGERGAYSREAFTGGAIASVSAPLGPATYQEFMFGLNSDPATDGNFQGLDFAFYLFSSGGGNNTYEVRAPGGAAALTSGTWLSTHNTFAIVYDGQRVTWLIDNVPVHQLFVGSGLTLSFDCALRGPSRLNDIVFAPVSGAGHSYTLMAGAGCVATSNTIEKVSGGSAWNAQAFSLESWTGGAFLSFRVPQSSLNKTFMMALNEDPSTDASYTSLDYAIYCEGGLLTIYESGTAAGTFGPILATDILSIRYDNSSIGYYKNGTLLRSVATSPGRTFFLDSSFNTVGAKAIDIAFGPAGAAGQTPLMAVARTTSIQFNANADGTLRAGQLPKSIIYDVFQGDTDVKAQATVGSLTFSGCTAVINSKNVDINALTGETGFVQVVWTLGGQSRTVRTDFITKRDGSSGSTAVQQVSTTVVTSTSYQQMGNTLAINASSTGKISSFANIDYGVDPNLTGSCSEQAKLQYRPSGTSTWLDFSTNTETVGTPARFNSVDQVFEGGNLTIFKTLQAGLTPGGAYEVRLLARRAAGGLTPTSQSNFLFAEQTP